MQRNILIVMRTGLFPLFIGGALASFVFGIDAPPTASTPTLSMPAASTSTIATPTVAEPDILTPFEVVPEESTSTVVTSTTVAPATPIVSTPTVSTPAVVAPIVSTTTSSTLVESTPTAAPSHSETIEEATPKNIVPSTRFSRTRFTPTQDLIFGTTVEDPYRWLEDGKSDEVKAWVNEQDHTVRQYLSNLPIRRPLKRRLDELMNEDDVSVPKEAAGKVFFTRRAAGKDRPTVYWHNLWEEEDHVLVRPSSDENEAIGEWKPSPDGNKFAYQLRKNNADEAVLHVRNVSDWTEDPKDEIPGANFADLSWADDSKGFYYVHLPMDPELSPADRVGEADIRFHKLGTSLSTDQHISPQTHNSSLYLSPSLSRDGNWLFVYEINGWTSNNIFFRDVHDSSSTFKPLFLSTAATAEAIEWGGILYIKTNQNAPNYRIMKTFIRQPDSASWTVLVPERPDTIIRSMNVVGGYLVLTIMHNAMMGIEVRKPDGSLERTDLEPLAGEIHEISGKEDTSNVYYDFDSILVPRHIFSLNVSDGKISTWSAPHYTIEASPYQAVEVRYLSKDGTPINMFIVEKKGLPQNGTVPFLMEGYGGFAEPALLHYSPMLIPWLEAGGGYALPNIRGGGEFGESWHQAGMLTNKQNTFDDFISAAIYLIENKYTRSDKLAIQGVSNGGLLMGVAMTQRPDLFRAVVCKSPLFDMIRYPLFGEGPAWVPEYGSPQVENQFRSLIAYSPYHNVKPGIAYPSTLIISAENDDRVDPMHARKMTATLQAATTSYHPILLETERHTGHSGAEKKQSAIDDFLDRLSFLMNSVGLKLTH